MSSVTQADAAGNRSAAAERVWTVDTKGPAAPTVTEKPAGRPSRTEATVAFASAEPGGSFTCSLDGKTAVRCSSPRVIQGLSEGEHSLVLRKIDEAGNTGDAVTVSWVVDLTRPRPRA